MTSPSKSSQTYLKLTVGADQRAGPWTARSSLTFVGSLNPGLLDGGYDGASESLIPPVPEGSDD